MDCTLRLKYRYMNNTESVEGSDDLPLNSMLSLSSISLSSDNISEGVSLIENGRYSIQCTLFDPEPDIETIELLLNGEVISRVDDLEDIDFDTSFRCQFPLQKDQPFLLLYDIAQLSVRVSLFNSPSISFFSSYLICLSTNIIDSENVKGMITELLDFDDPTINEWMFHSTFKSQDNFGMTEGSLRDHANKSLNTYLQMLEEIYVCYVHNLGYFRTQPHSVILQVHTLLPFEKIRKISTSGVLWLSQNMDQLHEAENSGITRNGQSYLPNKMLSSETKRSLNNFENQVVRSFLNAVYLRNASIISTLQEAIQKEEKFILSIKEMEKGDFRAPIIVVKEMNLENSIHTLKKLKNMNNGFRTLLTAYMDALPCNEIPFKEIPRKTKVFQELTAYVRVYELIVRWFRFGEFDFERENLIFHIRKIDTLYEYYCLYRLLKMLKDKGFHAYSENSIFSYAYQLHAQSLYQNETVVSNTYKLTDGQDIVTLFYVPVIHTNRFENSIHLYRTTTEWQNQSYFVPDFILKYEDASLQDKYVILDAKFSSYKNIVKFHLDEVIKKYVNRFAHKDNTYQSIVMMWVLQGRIDSNRVMRPFHTSTLANMFRPIPSFGVIPLNTYTKDLFPLWEEIQSVTHPMQFLAENELNSTAIPFRYRK